MRIQAESSYYEFVKQAFENVPEINKGKKFVNAKHYKKLCDKIESNIRKLIAGLPVKKMVVNVPPGTMKSIMCTVLPSDWCWAIGFPVHWLGLSNSDTLALGHGSQSRAVLESNWYKSNWGDMVSLSKSQSSVHDFYTTSKGRRFSSGMEGTYTGFHFNALSIDDPISPDKAKSETEKLKVNQIIDEKALTRHIDPNSFLVIIIQQRVDENDASGHELLKDPDGWEHINLPAECNEGEVKPADWIECYTDGLLDPVRFGREVLAIKKMDLGETKYACQYNQSPAPAEGIMLKKWYWQFCDFSKLPIRREDTDVFADTAFGVEAKKDASKGKNDPSGMMAATSIDGNLYIIEYVEDHLISPLWRPKLAKFVIKHGDLDASLVWIEPKANGRSQIDEIRINGIDVDGVNVRLNLPVMSIKESLLNESKEVRLDSQLSKVEGRRVWLPTGPMAYSYKDQNGQQVTVMVAEWVPHFIETCAKFPNSLHDEPVDLLTYACMYKLKQETDWSGF